MHYLEPKELQMIFSRCLKTTYKVSVLSLAWKQLSLVTLNQAKPLTKKDECSSESLQMFSAGPWANSGTRGLFND